MMPANQEYLVRNRDALVSGFCALVGLHAANRAQTPPRD